jgi:hypothetical protein
MVNTNIGSMEATDAIIILVQGIIAALFVFMPIFLIMFRELDKFRNNDIKEHSSGQSTGSAVLLVLISLALAKVAYIMFVLILLVIAPQWAPITGAGGVTSVFWTIGAPASSGAGLSKSFLFSTLNSLKIIRHAIETLSFVTILVIMFFSIKLSLNFFNVYSDDSDKNGLIMTIVKVFAGVVAGWFILVYYDIATSSILNHPNGGVWDVGIMWIEGGLNSFVSSGASTTPAVVTP